MPRHEATSPEERSGAPRVSFVTLGCRLNQHDTAAMRADLERAGWHACAAPSGADVAVVNTCTVTRRADQEARQLIRRIARESPGVEIVVTGCYAQRAPDELRGLPGVSLVLGTAEREAIAPRLSAHRARRPRDEAGSVAAGRMAPDGAAVSVAAGRAHRAAQVGAPAPLRFGRTRALLKIQDGCDSFCSYCIVPYVRGRDRSLPRSALLDQARRLLEAGFLELVLTGADLGSYGGPGCGSLASLVEGLLDLGPAHRIRISSIEPNKVPADLVELIGAEPRLCRHLHLPLQSGSAAILRAMRRGYAPGDYARLVERAARRGPIGIGADVIVGFPGEGEAEFEETLDLLRALPIAYLHVFRYSPRPGTRAAADADGVPEPVARERSKRLLALGVEKRHAFHRSLVGSTRSCLAENRRTAGGAVIATSDLYAPVTVAGEPPRGALFEVVVKGADHDSLSGVLPSG